MTTLYDCPKFERCNAPVCPLDPNWRRVPHLAGERVCLYLREYGKTAGAERMGTLLPADMAEAVAEAHRELTGSSGGGSGPGRSDIRHQLARAASSPSKIMSGRSRMAVLRP